MFFKVLKCALQPCLLAALFVLNVVTPHVSHAQSLGLVPAPDKKPAIHRAPEERVDDGFLDFAAQLLNFGRIPVPERKPALKSAALNAKIHKLFNAYEKDIENAVPLSKADQSLYAEIFALQERGKMTEASLKIKALENKRLLGHVFYQRYMHPRAYTSSFYELQQWLTAFNDHPGAQKIYSLAQKRKTDHSASLNQPSKNKSLRNPGDPTYRAGKTYVSSRERNADDKVQIRAYRKNIMKHLYAGDIEKAYILYRDDPVYAKLDTVEKDILRAEIAAAMMYAGRLDDAASLSQEAVQRSGLNVPKAGWVAGLTSWQNKQYSKASRYFEGAGRSPYASGWMTTAAAYWAARAHMRSGNAKAVGEWLRRGAYDTRTFYGMISTRALNHDFAFNWQIPPFTKERHDVLFALPAGARAIGLVEAGQPALAQAELLRLRPQSPELYDAMLAFAEYANLPGLAMRLANAAGVQEQNFYDAALYPLGPWQPAKGYRIDEALIHAIIRQESRFDPGAESPSGAQGLMQLMPRTAKYIAQGRDVPLDDPEVNLELGQRYLEKLLKSDHVQGELLALLIAYNAGPGNLAKWKRQWSEIEDPLLFIELLPSSETRAYIERVLANYWIYRMRAGQDTPTLDALAAGETAEYAMVSSLE